MTTAPIAWLKVSGRTREREAADGQDEAELPGLPEERAGTGADDGSCPSMRAMAAIGPLAER